MSRPSEQAAGRSFALIIATSSYEDPTLGQLRAPGQDASDLGAVLGDPAIGGYEIETLLNKPADALRRAIARFCARGGPHDLALVYLSCHGILDAHGHLHYAATDTERRLLSATAIEASWLNRQLEADCACRRQVLILDCCHSGAFARGARGGPEIALQEHFPAARGRAVLTASRATEYAFEGDKISGEGAAGVFTGALVDGLRDGKADRDGDGLISVTELYDYAEQHVGEHGRRQQPGISVFEGEGKLVVARNPRGPRIAAIPLPAELVELINDRRPAARIGAVADLAELLVGDNPGLGLTARAELERMAEEDIPRVARVARAALEQPGPPPPKEDESDEPEPNGDLIASTASTGGGRGPRRRVGLVVALLALTALTALIAIVAIPGGNAPAAVHIGAIYPLASGANASAAQDIVDGERLAVDYINNGRNYGQLKLPLRPGKGIPRLDGAKLELDPTSPQLTANDRCKVQAAFKALVDDHHVVAVLGAYESTLTLQGIDAADTLHVPLVNEGSTLWSLTAADNRMGQLQTACGPAPDRTPSPWFFRVGPSDEQAAGAFLAVAAQRSHLPIDKVRLTIVHEGHDAFGNGAATITKHVALKAGIPPGNITILSYPNALDLPLPSPSSPCTQGEQTLVDKLRAVVEQVQQEAPSPDVLIVASYLPDATGLIQTMQQLNYKRPLTFAYGAAFLSPQFATAVRATNPCGLPAADPTGIITRGSWAPPSDTANPSQNAVSIERDFEQHNGGKVMTSDAAIGFTAMMTLAAAIDKAGPSRDPNQIRQALAALQIPADETIMPWKGVTFDQSTGQNAGAQVVLQQLGATSAPAIYQDGILSSPAPGAGSRAG